LKQIAFLISFLISFDLCAQTQYFFGNSKFWTPDKKTALGETPYLVKREIDKKKKTITEYVVTLSRKPKEIYEEHKTVLVQSKDPLKFNIVDKAQNFNGFVKFEGEKDWEWKKWKYAIAFKNGDKMVGEGSLSSTEMKTEKLIVTSKKTAKVLIVDTLKVISELDHQKHLKDFVTGEILKKIKKK
jgi:hypothetical protein